MTTAPSPGRQPGSGLFPAGPPRPSYREPHPVRGLAVLAGLAGATCWLILFSLLGDELAGHVWWTVAAGAAAWLAALALVRYGDRGVAVGIAAATGLAWAVAGAAVAVHWGFSGDWPLW